MAKRKRRTSKMKTEIVLKRLKGEPLELLSRKYSVTASEISEWEQKFMMGGSEALKSQISTAEHKELEQAKRLLGEQAMEIEILKKRNQLIQKTKRN